MERQLRRLQGRGARRATSARAEQARDAIEAGLPTVVELTRADGQRMGGVLAVVPDHPARGLRGDPRHRRGRRVPAQDRASRAAAHRSGSASRAALVASAVDRRSCSRRCSRALPASREIIEGATMLIAVARALLGELLAHLEGRGGEVAAVHPREGERRRSSTAADARWRSSRSSPCIARAPRRRCSTRRCSTRAPQRRAADHARHRRRASRRWR